MDIHKRRTFSSRIVTSSFLSLSPISSFITLAAWLNLQVFHLSIYQSIIKEREREAEKERETGRQTVKQTERQT